MKLLLPYALLTLTYLFMSAQSIAQGVKVSSEKEWLIDHHFPKDGEFNKDLSSIFYNITLGKYEPAKATIKKLNSQQLNSIEKSAVLTYESNIAYNESQFALSINYCDSVLSLLQENRIHRYALRAMNFKAKALGALNEYFDAGLILDTVILFAKETDDQFSLGAAYYYYGSFYSDRGDYKTCVNYIKKSIVIREKIKDEQGLAACYSFLGLCYSHLDNYLLGIDYIQKSIQIRERIKDKRGLANSYLTMYKVYYELGEIDKALDSELKSLSICKELGDLQCLTGRYTNIGQIYQKKGQYKEALEYHFRALHLSKKVQIKNRIALIHENIARVYSLTNKTELAIKHIDSSLSIRYELKDQEGIASALLLLAGIQLDKGQTTIGIGNAQKSIEIAKKLRLRSMVKDAHLLLSKGYEQQKNAEKALYHFQQFTYLKDSLFNVNQSKELVRQELEFNFSRQQELQRQEQQKKEDAAKQKSRRQRNIILAGALILVLLSLILIFSIYQYRLKNKSQQELEGANKVLNNKNTELEVKNNIIESQSQTIQVKNQEITDSIHYARQIQRAILPTPTDFNAHFDAAFVLFEPKDLISGDFFWITKIDSKIIYATVDCTGHGVPGGFMSMLGMSMLNELVNEQGLLEPALILTRLREKVIASLRQKGAEGEQKDGMDMTLCVVDTKELTLTYALANHVLYLVRNNGSESELLEFKGDRHPVGIFSEKLMEFHQFEVPLIKGDRIYTFTDGYADQFGGQKGKKFKYLQLKELIQSAQTKNMQKQGELITTVFESWKGDLEQIDDVCLIGIEI
jgi:serine phosphatase RsbU (regulator of sigma subunit)